MKTLVLASASQARADMLAKAGVASRIEPARIDEQAIKAAMLAEDAPARDIADKLAEMKALRTSRKCAGDFVLGADQVLMCNGRIFDKATSRDEAAAHLRELRGRTHQLLSAAVIVRDSEPIWRHIGVARLTMRSFSDGFVEQYLDDLGDRVLETVGGYHLEGLGVQLFHAVDGDYFTVLGLPLLPVLAFLRTHDFLSE